MTDGEEAGVAYSLTDIHLATHGDTQERYEEEAGVAYSLTGIHLATHGDTQEREMKRQEWSTL